MFIHLIPGDPAKTLAGVEASVEEVEAIREEFGLNKPILVQYVDYMKNLFHGDMGRSLKSNLPVTEMIASRMHYTLRLVVAGMIWAPFLGIFIGVLCAIFRGKIFRPLRNAFRHHRPFRSRFLAGSDGHRAFLRPSWPSAHHRS